MSEIKSINNQLEKGELPVEFFSLVHPTNRDEFVIDWDKVHYNSFYRSYEHFQGRFTCDYSHIQGFEKVIEAIAEKNKEKTPLEEIEERQANPN